jgi:hypothetical protein
MNYLDGVMNDRTKSDNQRSEPTHTRTGSSRSDLRSMQKTLETKPATSKNAAPLVQSGSDVTSCGDIVDDIRELLPGPDFSIA